MKIDSKAKAWSLAQATLDITIRENPYIPQEPTPAQTRFLLCDKREAMYGGSGGGGKTSALLMAALQYVGTPGYNALLLRRTYGELSMPEGLLDRAHEWLAGTNARWMHDIMAYRFPSGANVVFGYLATEKDKFRYQGPAFQFIGDDELTQFERNRYLWLFSRMRRLEGSVIPVRRRSATNPGGIGHEWVKARFVKPGNADRPFFPAKLEDNPHLDRDDYIKSLNELDPVTRAQMLEGNWDVAPEGAMFKRSWFGTPVDAAPSTASKARTWDLAATEPHRKNKDPDWTVGLRMSKADGIYYVEHVIRDRISPRAVEQLVAQSAATDGPCRIRIPQDPGQAGKAQATHYRTNVIPGYDFRAMPDTGSKAVRAAPVASEAEAGNVRLVSGEWNEAFLDEVCAFPMGGHDDQVDALSLAYQTLATGGGGFAV